jgi:hypothetical protein
VVEKVFLTKQEEEPASKKVRKSRLRVFIFFDRDLHQH